MAADTATYAIVKTGGKQYKVAVGDIVKVEKIETEPGASVSLPVALVVDGANVTTDAPGSVILSGGALNVTGSQVLNELIDIHATVLAFPTVKSRLADAMFPANVSHGFSLLLFAENLDDLAFCEFRFLHFVPNLLNYLTLYFQTLQFFGELSQ